VPQVMEPEVLEPCRLHSSLPVAPEGFDDDDRADIAKAVCALANSSGGVIVYGVTTARDDRTKPTGFSGFDVRNVELFDQTVATRIQKPVVGLERKALPAENAKVLVVFVPKSVYSPHQDTLACRYYYRAGSVSRPMQHDLVELHFGRRLGPVLDLNVRVFDFLPGGITTLGLRVSVLNQGQRVGRFVEVILWLPAPPLLQGVAVTEGKALRIDQLHENRPTLQFIENVNVFHPRMNRRIIDLTLNLLTPNMSAVLDDPLFLQWAIYAEEMELRTGHLSLRELGVTM